MWRQILCALSPGECHGIPPHGEDGDQPAQWSGERVQQEEQAVAAHAREPSAQGGGGDEASGHQGNVEQVDGVAVAFTRDVPHGQAAGIQPQAEAELGQAGAGTDAPQRSGRAERHVQIDQRRQPQRDGKKPEGASWGTAQQQPAAQGEPQAEGHHTHRALRESYLLDAAAQSTLRARFI